jgi:hypothetical protein
MVGETVFYTINGLYGQPFREGLIGFAETISRLSAVMSVAGISAEYRLHSGKMMKFRFSRDEGMAFFLMAFGGPENSPEDEKNRWPQPSSWMRIGAVDLS